MIILEDIDLYAIYSGLIRHVAQPESFLRLSPFHEIIK